MGKFNRADKSGGGKKFGGDRSFKKGGRSENSSMYQAICSECGKNCEVPFKPTGDKPVFCSFCFSKKESTGAGRFDRRDSSKPGFEKKMFRAVCSECGKNCEVPFKPTGDKPVFCDDCFGRGERKSSGAKSVNSDQYKKQFELLNSKLDNILKMLQKNSTEKNNKEEKFEVEAIIEKTKEEMPAIESAKKTIDKKNKVKKIAPPKKEVASKKTEKKVSVKKKS